MSEPSISPSADAVGKLPVLKVLIQFLQPYRTQITIFLFALVCTAAVTLSIGQGLRLVIDQGFAQQSQQHLNTAILFIVGASMLMAIGTYVRFYLISWLGERVSADIRTAVFNHIVGITPGVF